jgi:hypothetical protein
MGKNTRFVGLDVHAETIAVAVAEGRNQVRSLGTIANRPEAVRRLLGKLGNLAELTVCYEAAHGLRAVPATDATGCAMRSDRAVARADEVGRSD